MHNEDQLRSYLAWAIHGRKPQRRATSPTRKGPPRDKTYLAWIREMPCIACGVEGRSVAAHTGTDGGMSQKASDYSCVPLCADCHTQAPGAYHRAGKGIPADTALRLARYLGTTSEFWLKLQVHYELRVSRQTKLKDIEHSV